MTRFALMTVLGAGALVLAPSGAADPAQEAALAQRYAPVVRLVAHTDCAPGKPYLPINVNLLFGEPTVALRGPWGPADLVKIGPTAKDLSKSLFHYPLAFPGSALAPSCRGEWSSNSSALSPILRSAAPSRTRVDLQKLQTANADAAERNSTGAPQFGHAAR